MKSELELLTSSVIIVHVTRWIKTNGVFLTVCYLWFPWLMSWKKSLYLSCCHLVNFKFMGFGGLVYPVENGT